MLSKREVHMYLYNGILGREMSAKKRKREIEMQQNEIDKQEMYVHTYIRMRIREGNGREEWRGEGGGGAGGREGGGHRSRYFQATRTWKATSKVSGIGSRQCCPGAQ